MEYLFVTFAAVLGTLVLGIRVLRRIRRSRGYLLLIGFLYWLVLWTAFYVIQEAVMPRPNLADTIVILLAITILQVLIVIVLPLARLQWTALGYAAAMALNVAGQFLVYNVVLDAKQVVIGGITYYTPYIRGLSSALWALLHSRPFFLPVNYGL
jgi:hypothetical protein